MLFQHMRNLYRMLNIPLTPFKGGILRPAYACTCWMQLDPSLRYDGMILVQYTRTQRTCARFGQA